MTQFDAAHPLLADALEKRGFNAMTDVQSAVPVSYTHLTLPTILRV